MGTATPPHSTWASPRRGFPRRAHPAAPTGLAAAYRGEAWPTLGEEERKVLLDYWVYHVQVIVEPIPGMKRANVKSAEVVLRTAPYDPKFFALNRQGPSAAASSDLTDSSDSTDALDDMAALASAEPTRPRLPWISLISAYFITG
jgi:hypothetical protein